MEPETKGEETVEERDKRLEGKKVKRKIESDRDLLEPKKMEGKESGEPGGREM